MKKEKNRMGKGKYKNDEIIVGDGFWVGLKIRGQRRNVKTISRFTWRRKGEENLHKHLPGFGRQEGNLKIFSDLFRSMVKLATMMYRIFHSLGDGCNRIKTIPSHISRKM